MLDLFCIETLEKDKNWRFTKRCSCILSLIQIKFDPTSN